MCSLYELGQIPSVPGVVLMLIEACQRPNAEMDEIVGVLHKDMGLSARVLGFSAGRALEGERAPRLLSEAVLALGLETIRSIAMSTAVHQFFSRHDAGVGRWLALFWERSLAGAHGARLLATLTGYERTEEAYLCGLFLNLGRLLFMHRQPITYPVALNRGGEGEALSRAEQSIFGLTGQEAGAALIRHWDPHSMLSDAVLYQDEAVEAVADAPHLVRLSHFARTLGDTGAESDAQYRNGKILLGLTAADVDELRAKTQSAVTEALTGVTVSRHLDGDNDFSVDGNGVRLALARKIRESAQMNGVRQHLSVAHDLKATLGAALQDCRILFGVNYSICFLEDTAGAYLLPQASNCPGERYIREFKIRLAPDSSLVSRAFLERARLSTWDTGEGALSVVDRQLQRMLESDGFICLPLFSSSEAGGVLVAGIDGEDLNSFRQKDSLLHCFSEAVFQAMSVRQKLVRERQFAVAQERERRQGELGKLAHEANNPLSIIKNYLQVLSVRLGEKDELQEQITILNEEIERVADIVAQVREQPKESEARQTKVDVNALIRDLVGIFRVSRFSSRNIVVSEALDPKLPSIFTDGDNLKQILTNLFKNASEVLPDHGHLMIATRDQINFNGTTYVEIMVEDNGPGIPLDVLGDVFTPVRSKKGGTHAGLGLTIVKDLVSELGGSVSCSNRSKGGARFVIMLPRKTE